jgi:hypothetical protein
MQDAPDNVCDMLSFLHCYLNAETSAIKAWSYDENSEEWDVHVRVECKHEQKRELHLKDINPEHNNMLVWCSAPFQWVLYMDDFDRGSVTLYIHTKNIHLEISP